MPRTLRDLAHTRADDKDDTSCISVIALCPECAEEFVLLKQHVTAERMRAHFVESVCSGVERYALSQFDVLNLVLRGAPAGGVTRLPALDAHGKSLPSVLLTLEIPG